MNRKDEVQKELEEISPFLAAKKKENPFEVPYGYFDKMQREVLEKALGETRSSRPLAPVSLWDQLLASFSFILQPRVMMGGLAIALLTSSVLFFGYQQQAEVLATRDQKWIEEAKAYIVANIDDFDDELLEELVFEGGAITDEALLKELETENQMIDEILDDFDGVDIEELL